MANPVHIIRGYKGSVTRLLNQIESQIQGRQIDALSLDKKLQDLENRYEKYKEFWEAREIKFHSGDISGDYDEELRVHAQFEQNFMDQCRNFQAARVAMHPLPPTRPTSPVNPVRADIKLPKLPLMKFEGDMLDWRPFWENFETHIHTNTSIPNVTKYNYLADALKGEAAKDLKPFPATSNGYEEAIDFLQKEYGNEQKQRRMLSRRLINMSPPSTSYESLKTFRRELIAVSKQFSKFNVDLEAADFLACEIVLQKIPESVQAKIVEDLKNLFPTFQQILTGLTNYLETEKEIKGMEVKGRKGTTPEEKSKVVNTQSQGKSLNSTPQPETSQKKNNRSSKKHKGQSPAKQVAAKVTDQNVANNRTCLFCNSMGHMTARCDVYQTIDARRKRLASLSRCTTCCKPHATSECNTEIYPCLKCNKMHHTWLCNKPRQQTVTAGAGERTTTQVCKANETVPLSSTALPTARVSIHNRRKYEATRAFFDQGSQRSFIRRSIVNKLKLPVIGKNEMTLSGFLADATMKTYDIVKPTVKLGNRYTTIEAVVLNKIPTEIQTPGIRATARELSYKVHLADYYHSDEVGNIGLLIGADAYAQFVTGLTRINNTNLLATPGGYMIYGSLSNKNHLKYTSTKVTVQKISMTPDPVQWAQASEEFEEPVHKLWDLDTIGIPQKEVAVENTVAHQAYLDTVTHEDGQYWVRLPWKVDKPHLPNNYQIAHGQLQSQLKKLRVEPEKLKFYDQVIKSHVELGFVEPVNEADLNKPCHYLPHHGVKKDSTTTPLRVVFNASSKKKGGASLNDCLMTGPNLTEKLGDVLLKFRTQQFAYTADISKAFLRVGLQKCDRDYTRFLWVENPMDPNSDILTLRFKSVLFGATSSPFLLQATLEHHFQTIESPVKDVLSHGFYVDNFIGTTNDLAELTLIYQEANKHLQSANMPLQQWATNVASFNRYIEDDFSSIEGDPYQVTNDINVLGLNWNLEEDKLNIKLPTFTEEVLTKRTLLALVSSVFDPLGLLSPLVITGKVLIQEAWKLHGTWDEALPLSLLTQWQKIVKELKNVHKFLFPRSVVTQQDTCELHIFCDASTKAYGAAAYVVAGQNSNLLLSKAKVAPLNTRTLPQLELTALLVGAQVLKYVVTTLSDINFSKLIIWTDNEATLQWVRNNNSNIVYVKNRVAEIQRITHEYSVDLLYVPTKENPADLLSRGVTTRIMKKNSLWFTGPSWLIHSEMWPVQKEHVVTINEITAEAELPMTCPTAFIAENRYSNFQKLMNVTTYVLKYVQLQYPILVLPTAEIYWFRFVQRKYFPQIFAILSTGKSNSKHEAAIHMIQDLGLFLDPETQLISSRGRLHHADLPSAAKFPILLSPESHVTRLLILYHHTAQYHCGVKETLISLRQLVWIPKGRQAVKKVLNSCVICNKVQGPAFKQPGPPPLPKERVQFTRAFQNIGVDYTGAFEVRNPETRETSKVYICLVTCTASRAIHLELAKDLSALTFLNLFRRFVAKYGLPNKIISDNGTNFTATANFLNHLVEEPAVSRYINEHKIEWTFNRARSPWEGGFFERMIGVVKTCLKFALYRRQVEHDELVTILSEVQARVNNRPLTYVETERLDVEALTPSHLVSGRRIQLLPPLMTVDEEDPTYDNHDLLNEQYSQLSKVISKFATRWQMEYLTALRERHYGASLPPTNPKLKIGEVVIVESEITREHWPLGRILRLLPDQYGTVRAVEVLCKGNKVVKTVNKLIPLEIQSPDLPGAVQEGSHEPILRNSMEFRVPGSPEEEQTEPEQLPQRPRRKAAERAQALNREILHESLE